VEVIGDLCSAHKRYLKPQIHCKALHKIDFLSQYLHLQLSARDWPAPTITQPDLNADKFFCPEFSRNALSLACMNMILKNALAIQVQRKE